MAESTDREDVTPTRLGDLGDVDSEAAPAVGDSLAWNGTEWAAGAAGMAPNGPLFNSYSYYRTTNILPNDANTYPPEYLNITEAPEDDTVAGYSGYTWSDVSAPLPRFGAWVLKSGQYAYQINTPGRYRIEARFTLTCSSAALSDFIECSLYGPGVLWNPPTSQFHSQGFTSIAGTVDQVVDVTPAVIASDEANSCYAQAAWYRRAGSQTGTGYSVQFIIWQLTPGAPVNVYP